METRLEQLQVEPERVRRELDAAREKQRGGEESFRRFRESGILGIVLVELSGRLLFANDAFLQMTGLTAEALTAGMVADSYAVWRFDRSLNPVNSDRSPADAISGTTAGPLPWKGRGLRRVRSLS